MTELPQKPGTQGEALRDASAAELQRLLRDLVARGAVRIEADLRRLDHMDCPIAIEADSNIWVYVGIPICGLVFWQFGLWAGCGAVAAALVFYYTLGRSYVRRRLVRRIHTTALEDGELWRRLWRFGGVALVVPGGGEAGGADARCAAPDGNWMGFVRSLAARGGAE